MAGAMRRPFRYVLPLMAAFDRDQIRAPRRRDDVRVQAMEGIMHKVTARTVARPVNEQDHAYATEWSMALWVLALAFLLATFQIY